MLAGAEGTPYPLGYHMLVETIFVDHQHVISPLRGTEEHAILLLVLFISIIAQVIFPLISKYSSVYLGFWKSKQIFKIWKIGEKMV